MQRMEYSEYNISKLNSRKNMSDVCENKRPSIYDELELKIEKILHKFFKGMLGVTGMNNGIIEPVEISEIELPMANIELDTDTLNRIQLSNEVGDSVDWSQEIGLRLQNKKRQERARKSKKEQNVRESVNGGKKVVRVSEEHTVSALEEIMPLNVKEELGRGKKGNDVVKGSGKNSSEYVPCEDESSQSYHEGNSLGNRLNGKRAHWEEGRTSGRSFGKGRSSSIKEKGESWGKLSSTPRFSDQGMGNRSKIEFTGNKVWKSWKSWKSQSWKSWKSLSWKSWKSWKSRKSQKSKDKEAREYITKTMNEDISYQKKVDRILTYLQSHSDIYCLEWADFELRSRMCNGLVLSPVFQHIDKIAKVKLCNLEANEQVLKEIIHGIAELPALPKFSLDNVLIHHTKPLVQLAQNCKLQEISFNNCRLKFLDEDKTSQIIHKAIHLRKFKMNRCMITDLNIFDIKDSLKLNESIQELNLSHNNIGKQGFENLMTVFPRNKTLVSVYLLETLVTTNDTPTNLEQAIAKRGKRLDLHLNSIP